MIAYVVKYVDIKSRVLRWIQDSYADIATRPAPQGPPAQNSLAVVPQQRNFVATNDMQVVDIVE